MPSIVTLYQDIIEKFGPPYGGEPMPSVDIEAYRGRLPDSFLDFWRTHGLGKWMKGYFQFCHPKKYQPILKMILEGDKDFDPEKTHAVGFSAFGRILAWNEQYHDMDIDVLEHCTDGGRYFNLKPEKTMGSRLGIALLNVDAGANDPSDEDGKPMFKRVFKTHGELEFGQIYAPRLHPALGGSFTVDNFRPADALVAMGIAVQTGPFVLENTTIPSVPAVRYIGG